MIVAFTPYCRNVFLPKSDHFEQKLKSQLAVESFCEDKAGHDMQRAAILESGQLRIRFLYTYEGMLVVKENVPGR